MLRERDQASERRETCCLYVVALLPKCIHLYYPILTTNRFEVNGLGYKREIERDRERRIVGQIVGSLYISPPFSFISRKPLAVWPASRIAMLLAN